MISFGITMGRFIFSESTLCKQLMQIDLWAARTHLQHGNGLWSFLGWINKHQVHTAAVPLVAAPQGPVCQTCSVKSPQRERQKHFYAGLDLPLWGLIWQGRCWSMRDPFSSNCAQHHVDEWGHGDSFKPPFSFQWLKIDYLKPDSPLQGWPLISEQLLPAKCLQLWALVGFKTRLSPLLFTRLKLNCVEL